MPVAMQGYTEHELRSLRTSLRAAKWASLDEVGTLFLPRAMPAATVASNVAHGCIEGGLRRTFLTSSLSNGSGGCYTTLSHALTPLAVVQLTDAVADELRDRFGGGELDRLARLGGGDGECLVLQYARDGVNYAHCDQPRASPYQFQLLVCLSTPGVDFTGGACHLLPRAGLRTSHRPTAR